MLQVQTGGPATGKRGQNQSSPKKCRLIEPRLQLNSPNSRKVCLSAADRLAVVEKSGEIFSDVIHGADLGVELEPGIFAVVERVAVVIGRGGVAVQPLLDDLALVGAVLRVQLDGEAVKDDSVGSIADVGRIGRRRTGGSRRGLRRGRKGHGKGSKDGNKSGGSELHRDFEENVGWFW
jgi:hypothetical protein